MNPACGILINSGKINTLIWTRSHEILQLPRESLKIVQDPKQNPMESTTILDKTQKHLGQEAKNLFQKYTSAYLSRLMRREGLRKIVWKPYGIWRSNRRIIDKTLCN